VRGDGVFIYGGKIGVEGVEGGGGVTVKGIRIKIRIRIRKRIRSKSRTGRVGGVGAGIEGVGVTICNICNIDGRGWVGVQGGCG
jgi:hypothetical protein